MTLYYCYYLQVFICISAEIFMQFKMFIVQYTEVKNNLLDNVTLKFSCRYLLFSHMALLFIYY